MKFSYQGAFYTVSFTAQDADDFADKWPTSTVSGKGSFQYDKRGNLVDATGSAAKGDGSDWLAFSQDLQAWGETQLKKTKGKPMESLSESILELRRLVEAAPKKLTGKKLDKEIERLFAKHGHGAQINIFNLGKISKAGKDAYEKGEDMEAAIVAAIKQYRENPESVQRSKPGLMEFMGKPAKAAVTKYFTDKMPKNLRKLMAAALDDLYQGPNVGTGFSYTKAIKELSSWWNDEGSEVWYDGESGEVLDSEPQGYDDEETGEHIEPEMGDYTHFGKRDAARVVFGALVTDGGMSI